MNKTFLPVEHYIDLIKANKPFAFARYGDGEMILMFNYHSVNGRGIGNLEAAIEPMKNIFRNKKEYYHCFLNCTLHAHSLKCFGVELQTVLDFLNDVCPDMPIYDGEVWQNESMPECRIGRIVEAIAPYEPVFVGGRHLAHVSDINGMGAIKHVLVHDRKAWDDYSVIIQQVREQIANGSKMICFSMGYPGKIMIDELFEETKDKVFLIDFGSFWDPYCGILSRAHMNILGKTYFQPHTKFKL